MRTEEEPRSSITGTVVVMYGNTTKKELDIIKDYIIGIYNCLPENIREIDTNKCDISGLMLDPSLYEPANIESVHEALWVLEDNLGNMEIADWRSEVTPPIYRDVIGKFTISTAYQHSGPVTLRVLVVEHI